MLDTRCSHLGCIEHPETSIQHPDFEHPASNIEPHLVKSLHPIDEIASRIARSDGPGVPSTRAGGATRLAPEVDPAAAVVRALAEPVAFPPLSSAILPGDHVAIAIDEAVPCLPAIVRGAVESLTSSGIAPADISIVTTDAQTSQLCRGELATTESGPQFVIHDPSDEKNLCLVGMTKRGQPLQVNRAIFDADVVLPIGCARVLGRSVYDCLYPRFSDAQTINRFQMPSHRDGGATRRARRIETDEAGWMIGALMTVEVVPGGGETVASVLAGEPRSVAQRSKKLCREQWLLHTPQRVSLIIATVTGDSHEQTWANVGRALASAERVLDEGGAVAICSNLDAGPGPSIGRLIGAADLAATTRKISRDHNADSWPAWRLARALQRGPVYFLSQLPAETIEDMGLAPVESVDDLVRLAGRHDSFLVVENSQHAVVTVNGVDDAN